MLCTAGQLQPLWSTRPEGVSTPLATAGDTQIGHKPAGRASMGFKVSADTGGTFIDVVIQDEASEQVIGKSLTTHDRVFRGLSTALAAAAEGVGLTAKQVLDDTDLFIY